jgi:IS5 family transposase
MRVIEVGQLGVDGEARWVKKGGKAVFGYKQHSLFDDSGLVMAVATTPAKQQNSQPFMDLRDNAVVNKGARVYAAIKPTPVKSTGRR